MRIGGQAPLGEWENLWPIFLKRLKKQVDDFAGPSVR
jgi:hypothetical protein